MFTHAPLAASHLKLVPLTPKQRLPRLGFGQLFIGDEGRCIVLEPKFPVQKGAVLYQAAPGQPIQKVGQHPVVEQWTQLIEGYGRLFQSGSDAFSAVALLFKQSMLQSNLAAWVPQVHQAAVTKTLSGGLPSPFNGGLKLESPTTAYPHSSGAGVLPTGGAFPTV